MKTNQTNICGLSLKAVLILATFTFGMLLQPESCSADKFRRAIKKIKKLSKSAAKGTANKLRLRTPSRNRPISRRESQPAPVAGPQRPNNAATSANPTAAYSNAASSVVYSRLPNQQPPQPRPSNREQFKNLLRQSPATRPDNTSGAAVRSSGQFQTKGNLNIVDTVARNLYGRTANQNSAGRNTLNRLANQPSNTQAANTSRRPYMQKIPEGLRRKPRD